MAPKKCFLIIDDDTDDRELFIEALREIDSEIVCYQATHGQHAIEILAEKGIVPDIIFLDLNMPVMNGWECLTILKEHDAHKKIPVFIYSTSSDQKDINNAIKKGAFCFCIKVDDYNNLKKMLKIIIDHLNDNLEEIIKKDHEIKSCHFKKKLTEPGSIDEVS